jgi:hypothetical protein
MPRLFTRCDGEGGTEDGKIAKFSSFLPYLRKATIK